MGTNCSSKHLVTLRRYYPDVKLIDSDNQIYIKEFLRPEA